MVDVRQISPITTANSISLKDTRSVSRRRARLIDAIDKPGPEVVIDVELLEIDRSKLLEYGLQVASPIPDVSPTGLSATVQVDPGRP